MVVCKYSSFAYAYEDGAKSDEVLTADQKLNKLVSLPSFWQYISYIQFLPTAALGQPIIPIVREIHESVGSIREDSFDSCPGHQVFSGSHLLDNHLHVVLPNVSSELCLNVGILKSLILVWSPLHFCLPYIYESKILFCLEVKFDQHRCLWIELWWFQNG